MQDSVRKFLIRKFAAAIVRIDNYLDRYECKHPGCDTEKVPGYDYCLDHGAGYR